MSELVENGTFRQDLLYRLRVARIQLPPLKDRREDIPLLIEWFLSLISTTTGKEVSSLNEDAFRTLVSYSWPGNVRELRNAIEFALVRSRGGEIRLFDLPPEIIESPVEQQPFGFGKMDEKQVITAALEKAGGNRSLAAKILGISRATLYRRLACLELVDEE